MEIKNNILRTSLMFNRDEELNNVYSSILKTIQNSKNILIEHCVKSLPNIFNEPVPILNKDSQNIVDYDELRYISRYENVVLSEKLYEENDILDFNHLKQNAKNSLTCLEHLFEKLKEVPNLDVIAFNIFYSAFNSNDNFYIYALEMGLNIDIDDKFYELYFPILAKEMEIKPDSQRRQTFFNSTLAGFSNFILEMGLFCKLLHDKYILTTHNKITAEVKQNAINDIKKYYDIDLFVSPVKIANYGDKIFVNSYIKFEGLKAIDTLLEILDKDKNDKENENNKNKDLPTC